MAKVIFDKDMKKLYGYTYNDVWNYYKALLVKFRGDDPDSQHNVYLITNTIHVLEGAFTLVNERAKETQKNTDPVSMELGKVILEGLYRLLDKMVHKHFPKFKEWLKND